MFLFLDGVHKLSFFQNIDVAARVYAIFELEMVNGSTSGVSTKGKCIHNKFILNLKLKIPHMHMIHFKNYNGFRMHWIAIFCIHITIHLWRRYAH